MFVRAPSLIGTNYWSVAQKDVGSLPLESYALVTSLVYWGLNTAAAERVQYYLQTYVRNASGVTPEEHPGMVPDVSLEPTLYYLLFVHHAVDSAFRRDSSFCYRVEWWKCTPARLLVFL